MNRIRDESMKNIVNSKKYYTFTWNYARILRLYFLTNFKKNRQNVLFI